MLIRSSSPSPNSYGPPAVEDPANLRGALFEQQPDGSQKILRYSGQTSPDSAPDVSGSAAADGEVFFAVDGIDQDWAGHQRQIKEWFHGGMANGAMLDRPVIGIHEGNRTKSSDSMRIFKNTFILKGLQAGVASVDSVRKAAYANDPSVKTIHDQLRQSLAVGRKVTLMAHSGGGSQVALAMSILAKEEDGMWKGPIARDVRVMGTAATATRDDLLKAGVKDENVFLTYSKKDSVPGFYLTPTDLRKPLSILKAAARGLALKHGESVRPGPWHQGFYIFGQNATPDGGNRIAKFLAGGPGGTSIID